MGDGAVDRHLGAEPDPHHHEAQLVDHAVAENPTEIVLDHGVEDREGRHQRADVEQDLDTHELYAGKGPGEGIDGDLGGKGAKKDRAPPGGLGICVGEPAVQKRKGTLDADGEEDQGRGKTVELHHLEAEHARGLVGAAQQYPRQQDHAGAHLEDEITDPRCIGAPCAARPDQEDRRDGHQFPEHVE